jgi:PAS domain S-box-containing protein
VPIDTEKGDEKFRILAETIPAAIFIYQGNKFRYVNRTAESLTGYTHEELLQLNFWDLVHPDFREMVQQRGLARQEGEEVRDRYEFKIATKNGEECWVDFTAGVTQFEGHPAALGTAFNITERKRAEEAVQRSAQTLEALHEIERAVLSGKSPEEIGQAALRRIRRLVPCQRGSVVLFNLERRQARFLAAESDADLGPQPGTALPLGDFSPSDILSQGPVRYLEDIGSLPGLPPLVEQLRKEGIRSIITAPLVAEGKLVGELNLSSVFPRAFQLEHQGIIHEIATQLAVGLQNARLLEAEKKARETADILRAASLALTQSLQLEAVLGTLLDFLRQLIPFDSANIMLLEGETHLVIRAVRGYPNVEQALRTRFNLGTNTLMHEIVSEQKSLLIEDTWQEPRWQRVTGCEHVDNWLGVPLVAGSRVIGLYSLDKSEAGFFTAEHLRLAEALAGQAAVAIENARLYEQSQLYATELERRATERREAEALQAAIYRISEAANSAPTLEELFRSIHQIVGELMPARNFYIALYDEAEDLLSFPYFVDEIDPPPDRPMKLGEMGRGLTGYVLRTGRPLLASPEVFEELVRQGEVELIGAPSIDWLGAPLKTEQRTIGVVVVQTYAEGVRFRERERNILQFVSNQIAMALEQRRAAEALRTSEERYRELVENANDIIYTQDLEGNFTSLNAAGERLTGYTREEILRKSMRDILAPEQIELSREMIARKLGGQTLTTYDLEITAKDGRRLALEVSTRLLYQGGKPVGVQGIARDVTQRKELEDQLRQAQKMEAVGRLAGGIAHDFNNLLAVLMGYSELMLDRLEPGDQLHKSAAEIGKAAERAATLTRQLLAFSRKQMLAPTVLDLNGVLSEMQDLLRRLIREDVQLRFAPGAGLGRVRADRGQLEQVILNLALNARDALPHGGKLTVETQNVELDAQYARRRAVVQPGSYVLLAVSDNGLGMDAQTQAHVFEPFFTTKEKGKGTGLGLATVYGIVKQSGGYIWVYSEPGHGTAFKVYLPRVQAPVEASKPAPAPNVATRASETILLVEDQEGVREVAREFLEATGYRVLESRSPADAVRIAQEFSGEIHLLLTDVVMPEMGGRELADCVQRLRPQMKVLFMSGYTDDAIVHHGVLDPDTAFLQKPFARGSLEQKVREVLEAPRRG